MKKVASGEKFSVRAQEWNQIADTVDYVRGLQMSDNRTVGGSRLAVNRVFVKNNTSVDLKQFAPIALGESLLLPTKNKESFYKDRAFNAEKYDNENYPNRTIAIIQEPLNASDERLAQAVVYGTTPAKININDEEDTHAKIADDNITLESCKSGLLKIMWKPSGTGEKECYVSLGLGGDSISLWVAMTDAVSGKAKFLPADSQGLPVGELADAIEKNILTNI